MKYFFSIITSVSLFLGGVILAHAQVAATIELSPETPEPRSTVTLTLTSYSFDVNTALIAWSINGVPVLSGVGERRLQVKTGNVGESQTVTVSAENQAGYFVEQKITITPASVILIHEAPRSYVPTFYEGRSFAATGGLVRVTALPSLSDGGTPLAPSSLSYTWYVNGDVVKSASGRGKQSANVRIDYLKSKTDVKVVVRTPSGTAVSKTISLSPFPIEPILYRYNEIFGTLLNSPIQGRLETTKVATIKLEPYFVSSKESTPPSYKWLLDGFDISPADGQTLGLTPKENSYGARELTIQVLGSDKRLQSAETSVEVIFDTRE